jgi:hypothetical protein
LVFAELRSLLPVDKNENEMMEEYREDKDKMDGHEIGMLVSKMGHGVYEQENMEEED